MKTSSRLPPDAMLFLSIPLISMNRNFSGKEKYSVNRRNPAKPRADQGNSASLSANPAGCTISFGTITGAGSVALSAKATDRTWPPSSSYNGSV